MLKISHGWKILGTYSLFKYSQAVEPKPGGINPPNNLAVSSPIVWGLRMVHFCIPPNNLKGCTAERKFGGKVFYSCWRPFFFWCSPKIEEKKCSIFEGDLFFWSSLEFGEKKCTVCIFLLVFTKFPHLNKIVVEVHSPPMLKIGRNWGKIANYPPQCSTKISTTVRRYWREIISFVCVKLW